VGFESQAARVELFIKSSQPLLQRRASDRERQIAQTQIEQSLVRHSIQFF
jgi:hypothetical protein